MALSTVNLLFNLAYMAWSVANIAYWIRSKQDPGSVRLYIARMAGIFNIVNLLIAIGSLRTTILKRHLLDTDPTLTRDLLGTLSVSALADLSYVAAGALIYFAWPRTRTPRRTGYSVGLMIQGAALLAFDASYKACLALSYLGDWKWWSLV